MNAYITATTDPCEEANFTKYIKQLQNAGVDYVHFDVMDGNFVPNKKLNAKIIKQEIEKNKNVQTVIHLMVSEPQTVIDEYIDCGAKFLIVHYEAFSNKKDLINCLKKINASATISGVALNPETPVSVLTKPILDNIGLVMIMGVIPGKSGQPMVKGTVEKVTEASNIAKDKFIACDGGINNTNIQEIIDAGTDFISLGSYMFKLINEGKAKQFLEQF